MITMRTCLCRRCSASTTPELKKVVSSNKPYHHGEAQVNCKHRDGSRHRLVTGRFDGGNEMTSGLGNRGRAVVTPILSLVNIGKRVRGIQALQNVSLEVEVQEIHALVGENSAGKSTLIQMVAGDARPGAGRI